VEAANVVEDLDERLLRQVFGPLPIAHHPIDEREHRPLVTVEQLPIRLLTPGGSEGDEVVVGGLDECQIQRSHSRSRVVPPYGAPLREVSATDEERLGLPRPARAGSLPAHFTVPTCPSRCRTQIELPCSPRRKKRRTMFAGCSPPSRRGTTC